MEKEEKAKELAVQSSPQTQVLAERIQALLAPSSRHHQSGTTGARASSLDTSAVHELMPEWALSPSVPVLPSLKEPSPPTAKSAPAMVALGSEDTVEKTKLGLSSKTVQRKNALSPKFFRMRFSTMQARCFWERGKQFPLSNSWCSGIISSTPLVPRTVCTHWPAGQETGVPWSHGATSRRRFACGLSQPSRLGVGAFRRQTRAELRTAVHV